MLSFNKFNWEKLLDKLERVKVRENEFVRISLTIKGVNDISHEI